MDVAGTTVGKHRWAGGAVVIDARHDQPGTTPKEVVNGNGGERMRMNKQRRVMWRRGAGKKRKKSWIDVGVRPVLGFVGGGRGEQTRLRALEVPAGEEGGAAQRRYLFSCGLADCYLVRQVQIFGVNGRPQTPPASLEKERWKPQKRLGRTGGRRPYQSPVRSRLKVSVAPRQTWCRALSR